MAEPRKVYHVGKREKDNKWAVHIQGSDKVIKLFDTKKEAEEYLKIMANNQKGTVLFHNSKGDRKGAIKTTQVHKTKKTK